MGESGDILPRNLAALRRTEPALAQRLERTAPVPLAWSPSRRGPWTASIEHEGKPLTLASRFDPEGEATRLIESVDPEQAACAVVLGVGLGYHLAPLVERVGPGGLLIVHEPDLALFRAVLERIDHTRWLGRPEVVVCDEAVESSRLTRRLEPYGALMTQGTRLVTHPPTRKRCGEQLNRFSNMVTETLAYCRTNVATALVNASRTGSNLAGNLAPYAAGATTEELCDAAAGFPAICVAAGPGLARNVDQLRDPEVRRRVVVITAQTTLKPLLDRGVQPDFVTALDYAPISRRSYEGLPDLPRVTLVAEPKAHPVILDHFPGPIRLTRSTFNDQLLGDLARPGTGLKAGATVAHLSFYLAQHLGCDPIILIGQDLGFSDGLYYMPGTAVHDVWSPELNVFNTLEMMEWQRIVRNRAHLQKHEDVHGRSIYTDEQMVTYRRQFERDFAEAEQTVIDATEGGVPKHHTRPMPLAEALAEHATRPTPALPIPPRELDPDRLERTERLLQRRLEQLADLRRTTGAAQPLLKRMRQHLDNPSRLRKIHRELQRHQQRVHAELGEVFALVEQINTVGAFNRGRTDRAISRADQKTPDQQKRKQGRQIDRDLENLDWLAQASEEAERILTDALERVRRHGAPRQGRGETSSDPDPRLVPKAQTLAVA